MFKQIFRFCMHMQSYNNLTKWLNKVLKLKNILIKLFF